MIEINSAAPLDQHPLYLPFPPSPLSTVLPGGVAAPPLDSSLLEGGAAAASTLAEAREVNLAANGVDYEGK